jgi:hypothetical protein
VHVKYRALRQFLAGDDVIFLQVGPRYEQAQGPGSPCEVVDVGVVRQLRRFDSVNLDDFVAHFEAVALVGGRSGHDAGDVVSLDLGRREGPLGVDLQPHQFVLRQFQHYDFGTSVQMCLRFLESASLDPLRRVVVPVEVSRPLRPVALELAAPSLARASPRRGGVRAQIESFGRGGLSAPPKFLVAGARPDGPRRRAKQGVVVLGVEERHRFEVSRQEQTGQVAEASSPVEGPLRRLVRQVVVGFVAPQRKEVSQRLHRAETRDSCGTTLFT